MQPSPQSAPFPPLGDTTLGGGPERPSRRDELMYTLMTIAAMLIVLVSVWVF